MRYEGMILAGMRFVVSDGENDPETVTVQSVHLAGRDKEPLILVKGSICANHVAESAFRQSIVCVLPSIYIQHGPAEPSRINGASFQRGTIQ